MILVTSGAGFIGSNFALDGLTYAGIFIIHQSLAGDPGHMFVPGEIANRDLFERLLAEHRVRAIVHFAAASHVDPSIHGPEAFVATNIVGTFRLLEAARAYWRALPPAERFLHVSTDESSARSAPSDEPLSEYRPYRPNSPYAASDHLVRAHHHTFGLPVVTTNGSSNYGTRQFPAKLISLCIPRALAVVNAGGKAQRHRRCQATSSVLNCIVSSCRQRRSSGWSAKPQETPHAGHKTPAPTCARRISTRRSSSRRSTASTPKESSRPSNRA